MWKRWLISLTVLVLAVTAAATAVGFALTGDGPGSSEREVRSDEGIDPNKCNWVHNINACDNDEPADQVADPPCCKKPHVSPPNPRFDGDAGPKDTEPGDKGGATYPGEEGTPVHPIEILEPDAGSTTPQPPDPVDAPDKEPRELQPAPDEDIDPYEYEDVLKLVREDLSRRLGLELDSISLSDIKRVLWGDTSLGNPQPTFLYAQMEVPGFTMVLSAGGKSYLYHTGSSQREVLSNQFVFVKGAAPLDTRGKKTSDEPRPVRVEPVSDDEEVGPPPPEVVPFPPREVPAETRGGVETLMDSLRPGATVELVGEVSQPFFSAPGLLINVDGESVQVFEYGDAASAGAEAGLISPDGYEISNPPTLIGWISTPHFYNRAMLIVLYVGDSPVVLKALEAVLGPQFAGG